MDRKYLAFMAMILLAGCNDGTGPDGQPTVSLSFHGGGLGANSAISLSRVGNPLSDGTNTLEITSAEVVLREIELERVDVTECDVEPEPDGCEEFEVGPTLVQVPLDGTVSRMLEVVVDTGHYDEIEFEIHKISDDPEDAAFAAQYPDLVDTSIRVTGFYNGAAFTYTSDLNEDQEFTISPPLEVTETTVSVNVTVFLDISVWFLDGAGNLVNPDSANKGGENENLVRDNIRDSIEAFEDRDSDGHDDSN